MKLIIEMALIACLMVSCVKTVDLAEYNTQQLKKELQHENLK